MVFVEDIAVSGEYINKFTDKRFVILDKPKYVELPTLNDPEKKEKKLLLRIELSDGVALDYYPNKTSIKTMANQYSFEMDKWVGKAFSFLIVPQKVAGQDKKVIYVAEKKLE